MVRNSVQALEARVAAAQATGDAATIEGLQLQLAEAQARHAGWKEENVRRRHNYLPLAIELLKILAEKGQLTTMLEEAKPRWEEKAKRLMEQRAQKKKEAAQG
mmetsp:Transcript_10499/g.31660  ORF Transcript_10499/g.31660 Transcript_10499/m.31660 type:complete len:103 (-) Transcript_10499:81-389(-)